MSSNLSINNALCNACGSCVKECGHHVQHQKEERINPNNSECIGCYHCFTVCPRNAIEIKSNPNAPAFSEELLGTISEENLTQFLAYRRSIRSFKDKIVEESLVEKLIEKARYIPSGGNAHSYEFTVIKSEEAKKNIKQELYNIYKMRSRVLNNVILRNVLKPFVNTQMKGFLKDKAYRERIRKLIDRIYEGDDPFFYNAPVVVVIHSKASIPTPKEDCVLAGYNITLMAQVFGLGSCFVTLAQNAINASSRCKKVINISPQDNINAVIILGYPAVQHRRIAPKPSKKINWC